MQERNYTKRVFRIYTLTNPENGHVFYVGRTSSPLFRRLTQHNYIGQHSNVNRLLKEYLLNLHRKGVQPIIDEVDQADYEGRTRVEEYWIQQMAAWGFSLTNVRHYATRNFVKAPQISRLTIEEIGLFDRIKRKGDFLDIALISGVSTNTITKHYYRHRGPQLIVEAIRTFYMKRVKEISDWYVRQLNNQKSLAA